MAKITKSAKNSKFQESSKSDIFALKLAVPKLTKSMFPWFNRWINHVFLYKTSYILKISHEIMKKSSNFGQTYRSVKNSEFQKSSKIELFTLQLAASKLTKSMFPCFNMWVNHVLLYKMSYILKISIEIWKKSPNFG